MMKLYRFLGKRGRIGFRYNDVLSFTKLDDNSVVVCKEKICDNCNEYLDEFEGDFEENITLEDFLDSLSEEEQRDALVHLSLLWAEKQKH